MNDLNTKEKILKESHKLFACKGYNGVSVREIAKVCDVNIAAINYHFKNKENLYGETIVRSIHATDRDIKAIFEQLDEKNITELALNCLRHFIANSEDLKTGFKLILSSDHFSPHIGQELEKFQGPPGGDYLYQCLKAEFPKAEEEDIGWAVRIIFNQVIHKALVMCNPSICESMSEIGLGVNVFEQDLIRLVDLIKTSLKDSE